MTHPVLLIWHIYLHHRNTSKRIHAIFISLFLQFLSLLRIAKKMSQTSNFNIVNHWFLKWSGNIYALITALDFQCCPYVLLFNLSENPLIHCATDQKRIKNFPKKNWKFLCLRTRNFAKLAHLSFFHWILTIR